MRREWSGFIRTRNWHELELLAKGEPSQQLADTVSELERAITENADRRALRRILFLLARSGYQPEAVEPADISEADDADPARYGILGAADGRGDVPIVYAREERGRIRWLSAVVNASKGIVFASEETCAESETAQALERHLAALNSTGPAREVEPAYAMFRIAEALRRFPNAPVPSTIAYWRVRLGEARDMPHPGANIAPSDVDSASLRSAALRLPSARFWRLELGAGASLIRELHEARTADTNDADGESERLMAEARKRHFTPEVVQDHAARLRDLAFLLETSDPESAGLSMAAALDLEKAGPDSEYAKATLAKTVLLVAESLKRSSAREPAMVREPG